MQGIIGDSLTKSVTYILPMLGYSIKEFVNIVNCYIADEGKPQYTNHIFLLHKFDGRSNADYLSYEETLVEHEHFEELYDPDRSHVMFIFRVPEYFQREYDLFKMGKYSKFNDDYKKHILNFLGPKYKTSKTRQVLYKSKKLKKDMENRLGVNLTENMELSSVPNLEQETYKLTDRIIHPLKDSFKEHENSDEKED